MSHSLAAGWKNFKLFDSQEIESYLKLEGEKTVYDLRIRNK